MRRFGSTVTGIEHNGRLLHHEDEDVSEAIASLFQDDGIEVSSNAKVVEVKGRSGSRVTVVLEKHGDRKTIEGTHILVAAGRVPNTEDLGLERAEVDTTQDGYIVVDDRLHTAAADVWTVGGVAGSPKFTHVGKDDYRVFRAQMMGEQRVTAGRLIRTVCL